MGAEADDLARRARTLAQAHPLTALASDFVNRSAGEQVRAQPMAEVAAWVTAALTNGYCVRRVEENDAGLILQFQPDAGVDVDRLGEEAGRIAAEVREGRSNGSFLVDEDLVIDALDRIISSEVGRRTDNVKGSIDEAATDEVAEYLTWWVVQGYALRVAEQECGVVA